MTQAVERERSRTDHRYVAEVEANTGVLLRGTSDWQPKHWDPEPLRRQATDRVRFQIAGARALGVRVGSIRVYRETRWAETVTTTYINSQFDSEVKE